MDTEEEKEFAWAKEEARTLRERVKSCMLATVSSDGQPLSSYAPFFWDEHGRFYVFVSAMAKHYGHLRKNGKTSLSLIEDEAAAENLFARKRLTVDCVASLIVRGSEEWESGIAGLVARHGSTMEYLKDLVDFDLFALEPGEGRLVLGFGKAYRIFGEGLGELSHLGAGGHRTQR